MLCYGGRVQLSSETSQAELWQWPSTGALLTKGLGQGCIGRGRRLPPPPPGRLCLATVPLLASASLNGICNRQEPPPTALATPSNRLSNRFWGRL